MVFPNTARKYRKEFKLLKNKYDNLRNSKKVFQRMKHFQISALKCLASYGLIDNNLLIRGKVGLSIDKLPIGLDEMIELSNINNNTLLELLSGPLYEIKVNGKDGLKNRTKLMESNYDQI